MKSQAKNTKELSIETPVGCISNGAQDKELGNKKAERLDISDKAFGEEKIQGLTKAYVQQHSKRCQK